MTYSIVARDPVDGSLGVAVQSAWFAVGHIVPWVNAGVGVVATQAFADPTYGPRGLTLMRNGLGAAKSLEALVEADEGRDQRQVAMLDAMGEVAVHTGAACLDHAEQVMRNQASCQGNILRNQGTCEAMMQAYESASGEFVDRLCAAMVAAETAGGDARGRQSAALLVVSAENRKDLFSDRLFDVRIDDHADPVNELLRIVSVQRAYRMLDLSTEHFVAGEYDEAADLVLTAAELMPHDANVVMWSAMVLLGTGRTEDAKQLAATHTSVNVDWPDMAARFSAANGAGLPEGLDASAMSQLERAAQQAR